MPKTFSARVEYGMREQDQLQQTGRSYLTDLDEDDYEDDEQYAQTAFELRPSRDQINQSEYPARHPDANRPIEGVSPGTSLYNASVKQNLPFMFNDAMFGDNIASAPVDIPRYGRSRHGKKKARRDQMLSLLDELNSLSEAKTRDQIASDKNGPQSILQWMKTARMLGTGRPHDFNAARHDRMTAIQEELDRQFPNYETYLYEKSIREIGHHIHLLKKRSQQLTHNPMSSAHSGIDVERTRDLIAQLRRAQTITKRMHVEHLHRVACTNGLVSYDLSSYRNIFAYVIYATDTVRSMIAPSSVNAGQPAPSSHNDWWFADGAAIPSRQYGKTILGAAMDAALARVDSMSDDIAPGQASEISLPVQLSTEETQQYAELIIDSLPEDFFAGELGSPANTTSSRDMLKEIVCEQLAEEWTRPATTDGHSPATSMSSPSDRPAPASNVAYTAVPMLLAHRQAQGNRALNPGMAGIIGSIISGAIYLTAAATKSWWPFNGNAEQSTSLPPSAPVTTVTEGPTGNVSDIFIDGVTNHESTGPSEHLGSGNQTTASEHVSQVISPTPSNIMLQSDQLSAVEDFRINLRERLSATIPILTFVQEQLRLLIQDANLGLSTNQVLDTQNTPPSVPAAPTLKTFLAQLGVEIPDVDEKLALTNTAPYNRSIVLIEEFIKEAQLFQQSIGNATEAHLTALQEQISWLETLPRLPPVRNRDMWKALTNGRNILALWDLRQTDKYSDFISGYDLQMTAGQKNIETSLLRKDFLRHAAADFRRAFGVWPGDPNHAAAEKFRIWAQSVKTLYDRLSQGDLQIKLRDYKRLLDTSISDTARKSHLQEIVASESMRGLHRDLTKKLKELPATLLQNSELENLKMRSEARMSAMQAGRAINSVPAFTGVGNRIVGAIYANTTIARVTGSLGAFEELFAAIKVPWEIALTAYDTAKETGTSFWTEINKKTWKPFKTEFQIELDQLQRLPLRKKISADGETIELRTMSNSKRGFEIPLQKLHDNSIEISRHVSKMAHRDPLALRQGNALIKQIRNQAPFFAQDIMSLIINSYTYASKAKISSAAERAELSLKITASLSYLSGTSVGTFLKGHSQILGQRGLNAMGVAASIGAGIANIVKISERTDENRGRDMGLATAQLIADTTAMVGAIALPVIGTLLTLAIPNFASIGFAMDYHQAALSLVAQGKPLEAAMARAMRDMAIADAIPVVNWLAFIYQPLTMQAHTVQDSAIDETVANSVISQLQAMQPSIATLLPEAVGGSSVYPMLITPVTLPVAYFRNRPGPATPHMPDLRINETQHITLWVAFGKGSGKIHVFPEEIRHSVWQNGQRSLSGVAYAAMQDSSILRSHAYANRSVLAHGQIHDKIPEFIIIDGRSSAIDTSKITLYLRNRHAARPAVYVVQDQGLGYLRIHANDERSTFVVSKQPQYINGYGGRNTVEFAPDSTVSAIDLTRFINVTTVYGPPSSRKVTGNVQNMTYVQSKDNTAVSEELIRLQGHNNTVIAMGGSNIDLGAGDSRIIAQGIPKTAKGGAGNDLLSFQFSPLEGIRMAGNTLSTIPETSESGNMDGFEFVQLSEGNDKVEGLPTNSEIQVLDLGAGNDTVSIDGRSNFTLLLGEGSDNVTISAQRAYNNLHIYGDAGPKRIAMELQGQDNVIVTRGGNNSVRLVGSTLTDNSAALALGGTNNQVELAGDLAVDYHITRDSGAAVIRDDVKRSKPLHIVFRGTLTKDDINPTLFLPIGTTDSVEVRLSIKNEDGASFTDTLTINTWPGANVLITTEGDGQTFRLN